MMQRLGTTSRVHVCARCGKRNLSKTVAFRDGRNVTHYGAECARRVKSTRRRSESREVYGDPTVPFLARDWYSGQSDPLYAIASSGWPQPLETIEHALSNTIASRRDFDAQMKKKYGRRKKWSKEDSTADDDLRQLQDGLEESVRRQAREEWY